MIAGYSHRAVTLLYLGLAVLGAVLAVLWIYRVAVVRAVEHCLARWPQLHLYLDKRYTNPSSARHWNETIPVP